MSSGMDRAARPLLKAGPIALALSLVAVALLLLPLIAMLLEPVFAGRGTGARGDDYAVEPLRNSVLFAAGSAALSCLIASLYAALVVWTNVAGRRLIYAIVLFPLFLPTMIYGFAWILLAAPNAGMINRAAGAPLVNIYSLGGMIWVEALHSVPVVFLLLAGVFRSVTADAVSAARLTGASRWKTFRRIVMPTVAGGMVAGFLLVFVRALGAFEIPAIIGISAGIELVSTHIYLELRHNLDDLTSVSMFAGTVMILAISLTYAGRFATSDNGDRGLDTAHGGGLRIDLGRKRYAVGGIVIMVLALLAALPLYALLAKSLTTRAEMPLLGIGLWNLENYAKVLGDPAIWEAGLRSLAWGSAATLAVMVLAVVLVWASTRMKSVMADRVISLSQIVFCLPGVIIGVGVLVFYGRLDWLGRSAGMLIAIVYVLRGFPYALVYALNALQPLATDIWDSGRMSGASRLTMLRRVVLPLAGPALFAGAAYILAISIREISATVLLYQPGEEFLSVFLWQFWQDGDLGRLAALSICLTGVTASLLLASYRMLATLPVR